VSAAQGEPTRSSLAAAPLALVPLQASDAAALSVIESLVFPHPWNAVQLAAELRLPTALGVAFAAEGGAAATERVVAFALFRRLLDEAELLRLAVLPAWRRRGLAAALVEHGLAQLRATGVTSAFLEVRADNDTAIAFYERGGWAQAGRRARYYPDGADALLYRRQL
jgi:ribosomal-protein-alanine N-acetyltransferase